MYYLSQRTADEVEGNYVFTCACLSVSANSRKLTMLGPMNGILRMLETVSDMGIAKQA